MTREELAKKLQEEYAKDGEPITFEEALECADMEIKAGSIKNYTSTEKGKEKKKTTKERKVDNEKLELLNIFGNALSEIDVDFTRETETKLHFNYNGSDYTIMLTKHRTKKG